MDNGELFGSLGLSAFLGFVADMLFIPDKLNVLTSLINLFTSLPSFSTTAATAPSTAFAWIPGYMMSYVGIIIYLSISAAIEGAIVSIISKLG